MRTAVALAISAFALAACVGFPRPTPDDLTASLDTYVTPDLAWRDWPSKLAADDPAFKDALFTPGDDCDRMGAYVICDGRFTLADGVERKVRLWLLRPNGQWRLMDVVLENAEL